MNGVILAVSRLLAKILNPLIVILAIAEIILMVMAYNRMIALKKRIDLLNGETPGKQVLRSRRQGKVETEYTVKVEKDWKEFDSFCDNYQNDSMLFSSVSLIIQIFPLLGLLGTVTGLFIAMNSNADWSNAQNLFEGVQFALSSTVLGILFAVIFKFVDIVFCSRYLNYIDDGIDRFRESYNVARELPLGGEEK